MFKPPSRRLRRLPRVLALSMLALPAACSWAVPADPGENARLRSRSLDVGPTAPSMPGRSDGSVDGRGASPVRALGGDATDDGAIYRQRCGQCHEPFSPRHASAGEWPGYVRKYGPRAGLFGEERARVLRWLQANAR